MSKKRQRELVRHPELRLIAAARQLAKEVDKAIALVNELVSSVKALDQHEGKLPRETYE